MAVQIPALPTLHDKHKLGKLMRGPTEGSNWVIPGMLMCGPYPGALDDKNNDMFLKRILAKGIDTFVCLQEEYHEDIPEDVWRSGQGLRPYFTDAQRLSNKELKWVHLPIVDGTIAPDDLTAELVVLIVTRIISGHVIYLHCFGGHGRAGVMSCLILSYLYRISAAEAMKRTQAYHDCRVEPQGVKSPTTVVQRDQVKRQVQELLNCQPPEVEIKQEELSIDIDATKRGGMRPTKKLTHTASCPAINNGGSSNSSTPTRQRPVHIKISVQENAMPDFLSLPALRPGASAETKRLAMLRQKSMGVALRRKQFQNPDGLAELRQPFAHLA